MISFYVIPGLKDMGDLPSKLHTQTQVNEITPEDIIKATSDYLDIPIELIIKRGRKRENVYARKICVYLMRRYTELSLENVGKFFTNALTDHTSVRHSQNYIHKQITGKFKNKQITADLNSIIQIIEKDETVKANLFTDKIRLKTI